MITVITSLEEGKEITRMNGEPIGRRNVEYLSVVIMANHLMEPTT